MAGRYSKITKQSYLLVAILVVAVIAIFIVVRLHEGNKVDSQISNNAMRLISPEFKDAGVIPKQYTCTGNNISPPLSLTGVPANTKSLAIIMHDPDAPGVDFVHWLIWDIPANTSTIAAGSVPVGAVQGKNGFGSSEYGGPCPPSGTHHYKFELYALDTTLNLNSGSSREDLQNAMKNHTVAQATLTGLVSAE